MPLRLPIRLGLGYAVAIVTLLLVLAVNLTAFQVARQETRLIHDNFIPSLHAARGLIVELERMENSEFLYFAPGQDPKAWMNRFDRASADFERWYLAVEPLVLSPEERAYHAEIGRHYGAFKHIDQRMRRMIAQGRAEEARLLNTTESLESATSVRRNARALYNLNLEESVRARNTEDRTLLVTQLAALVIGLSGTVLAAWTWLRVSRDIVTPLQGLQQAAGAIAGGLFVSAHHPAAAKTTEIAQLQTDFNRMAAHLNEVTENLKQAKDTLEIQVATRTEALATANQRLEQMVNELQTLDQLKSDFLAVMSHELLTPLNFISGFGSALEDGLMGPLNPAQMEAINKMMEGADRLTRMVRNTLEYTQLEADRLALYPEEVDYELLIDETAERFTPQAQARHQRIEVQTAHHLPLVLADPARAAQLLGELLDNALKFSSEGRPVRLSVTTTPEWVITDISDQGTGIPKEALSQIFQPFYQVDATSTRQHGGMGLGLPIAQGLAQQMNGRLEVHSRLGQGTTVRVYLPRADHQVAQPVATLRSVRL